MVVIFISVVLLVDEILGLGVDADRGEAQTRCRAGIAFRRDRLCQLRRP
jgi:hypothetical protein